MVFYGFLLALSPNLCNHILKDCYEKGLLTKLYTHKDYIQKCIEKGYIELGDK